MKRLLNLFVVAVLLLPAGVFAADTAPQKTSNQKGLPDSLMEWMSERYGAKTMLGLKWANPAKARTQYVLENNAAHEFALMNPLLANKPGHRRGPAARKAATGRLDIMPVCAVLDEDAWETTTDSYLEIKYSGPGASWNVGYIKYSEMREYDVSDTVSTANTYDYTSGTKYHITEASVLFGAFVLTLPIENLSYYAFAGPAIVSYDSSEAGTYTTTSYIWSPYSSSSMSGTYSGAKSGTAPTWIAGAGMSLRLSDSGFGVFGEFKHIPESGDFIGLDSIGGGVSFGF